MIIIVSGPFSGPCHRGRIVASGRHDGLVAAHGLYARLAALQFRDTPEAPVQPVAGQI